MKRLLNSADSCTRLKPGVNGTLTEAGTRPPVCSKQSLRWTGFWLRLNVILTKLDRLQRLRPAWMLGDYRDLTMLPGLYDIYVLSGERSASALDRFFIRFAPRREEAADNFAVQDAALGFEQVFDNSTTALAYCFAHSSASAGFYWHCLSSPPKQAMAFFTKDGGLIFGLSTSEFDSAKALAELRAFVTGVAPGYICFEQPPPETITEFLTYAHRSQVA